MQNIVVLVALCDVTSVLIVKRLVMEQIHGHEVLHMMEGLKLLLQTLNDTNGLFDGWLLNIYLLETPDDSPRF